MSKKIVDAHHGHIDVESEVGRGTRFTVVLPSKARMPVGEGGRMMRRMLIVDDEETIRWALAELFMQDGWAVQCAADGEEAVRRVEEDPFEFMITDLKMPGLPGVEVVRRARRANPAMGVMVLTGYASLETAVEAVRLGAWDYVTKPCDVRYLRSRVEQFTRERGGEQLRLASRTPLSLQDVEELPRRRRHGAAPPGATGRGRRAWRRPWPSFGTCSWTWAWAGSAARS